MSRPTATLPDDTAAPLPHSTSAAAVPGSAVLASIGVLAAWFALTIALRPLAIPDEGRYVGVAWEMLRRGDWQVPTLDGLPYFHKPPLFYWLTAAAISVFGPGLAAARAASWLAAVALGAGTFAFTQRWLGAAIARRALVVLATLPLFYGGAQFANLDMLVAACIGLCILAMAHAVLAAEHGTPAGWAAAAAFAMAAAGVLAKGLIGAVLPGLVLVAWAVATGRVRPLLRLLVSWPGWLVFAAIAAPWFAVMDRRFGGFVHYFFVVQHVERFAGSAFNNVQPFWFYVPVLALGMLPWSVVGAWRWREAMRPVEPAARDVRTLMLIWAACIVGFFSLPHSKLVGYVFPALAPLAVLVAMALGRMPLRRLGLVGAFSAALCIGLVASVAYVAPKSEAPLALALRQEMRPDDGVAFVDHYYFDVPFYARLDRPAWVVDRWLPQDTARDSWRRELIDAQGFDTAGGPSRLLHPQELIERLCATSRPVWVMAPRDGGSVAWLAKLPPRHAHGGTALWRIDPAPAGERAALPCPR